MKTYKLVVGSQTTLNENVTHWLNEGYELVGIPFYSHILGTGDYAIIMYAQAVAKLTND